MRSYEVHTHPSKYTREFFTRVNVEVWTSSLLFTVHPGVHPYARVFTLASTGLWAAVPPTPADTCDGTAEDKNGYIDEGVTGRTRSLGFLREKAFLTDGWVGSQAGVLMVRRSDISLTGVTRMGDVRGLLSLLFMSWLNNEFEEVPPALSAVTGVQIFWKVGSYVVRIGISSADVEVQCLISTTIFFVRVNTNKFSVISSWRSQKASRLSCPCRSSALPWPSRSGPSTGRPRRT